MSKIEEMAKAFSKSGRADGTAAGSFIAGARWVLEETRKLSDDFGVNKPYVLIADLESLFSEQGKREGAIETVCMVCKEASKLIICEGCACKRFGPKEGGADE